MFKAADKRLNEWRDELLRRQTAAEERARQAADRLKEEQEAEKALKVAAEEERKEHFARVARMHEYRRNKVEEVRRHYAVAPIIAFKIRCIAFLLFL